MSAERRLKKAVSAEGIIFLILFLGFFVTLGSVMGIINMFNTLMNTAFRLLIDTVFYIMGIAVLAGAISGLLSEFGVVALINKLLSPLMGPIYDLPGASTIGVVTTYLSDNPAILTLADDKGFRRYFKKYQLPALTNLGTAFGMGLIITTYMMGQTSPSGESFIIPAIIGNIGAILGSIVSTRLMLRHTKKYYGTEEYCVMDDGTNYDMLNYREIREGSVGSRLLSAMLEGGTSGVQMGMAIIPGVLIICTLVLMLTNGPSEAGVYTGAAFEGVGILPWIGQKLEFILKPLFGFQSPEAIAFPITSLGAAGAAISLVPDMLQKSLIGANEIAVFTAMGMCWSGYLSTHVAMMDGLKCRELTGKAIISHTFGGLVAGISAHFLYLLFNMII
ncbi:CD0519/CD1768 family membrane protein [Clostridium culturomicium]|uniref:CD0519/CD1768 family membrane protein n=1 Tax=Clostridium culturomicium TaxID=1499683 RepID=UPI00058B74C3|nr:membrane protein [Clostridium culturomicium]